jgi:hypothetical protein
MQPSRVLQKYKSTGARLSRRLRDVRRSASAADAICDKAADDAESFDLLGGKWIKDELTYGIHVPGRRVYDAIPAGLGQDRVGVAAIRLLTSALK